MYSLARILLIAMGSVPVLSHSSTEAFAFHSFASSMTKVYSPTEYRNTRCKGIQYLIHIFQWLGGTANRNTLELITASLPVFITIFKENRHPRLQKSVQCKRGLRTSLYIRQKMASNPELNDLSHWEEG